MQRERSRLNTKFREELRNVDPKNAVMMHLKDMWRSQPTPSMDDLETVGSVVSNIYSEDEDYLVITDTCYVLVGKNASVNYGEFDGYSSGNKSRKQIIDGLTRTGDYTIYKLNQQFEDNGNKKTIVTLLNVEGVNVVNRKILSSGYEFSMDEVELDRETNTFVLKELFFDGLQYFTKHGTIVKNIMPRKVTMVNASNSGISGLDSEQLSSDNDGTRQESLEESPEE